MAGRRSSRPDPHANIYRLRTNVSGMAQNKPEDFLGPDSAIDIVNMHSTQEGSWTAHNVGYTKLNQGGTAYESGASVDGLHWFVGSDFVNHLICAINGKLKNIDMGTGALTAIDDTAGFTPGQSVSFESLNNVLYTVDGTIDAPRRWDGTTAATAAGWPVTLANGDTFQGPKYIVEWQNHMVFLNMQGGTGTANQYPSTFIVSDLDNPEVFTLTGQGAAGAYINDAGGGDGQQIVGARALHIPASNSSALIIFKDRSTYALTGTSAVLTDADAYKVVLVNPKYGAINENCIVQVGNDIYALNEFGVTSYTSSGYSGDIQPNPINSDRVKDVFARLNLNAKDKCWGIHLPHRREVIFWMPTGASSVCNEGVVYKYPAPGTTDELPKWSRRLDSGNKFLLAHGCLVHSTFYIGTTSGIVGTMFTASRYDDLGIPWSYEFPFWSAGNEKQVKRLLSGVAYFKVHSTQLVNLVTKWKGGNNNDVMTQTLTVETTVAGAVFGVGIYGQSAYGDQEELKVPYNAPGNGEWLKHTFSGITTDSGPEFLGLGLVAQMGGISQFWN